MSESRQVRRAQERQSKKTYWDNPILTRLQLYWIPLKRKSRAGIEYIYYKKILDKIGLGKK